MEPTLKDARTPSELNEYLRKSALKHGYFKFYLPMERALDLIVTGKLFLSDGSHWNDISDRKQMSKPNLFGKCFSCAAGESIAMWMLYGGGGGCDGAMISFTGTMMRQILKSKMFLTQCEDDGTLEETELLSNQYELFLTDILYIDQCQDDDVKMTCGEQHRTENIAILKDEDIFTKSYPWSYERECRLVAKILDKSLLTPKDGKVNLYIQLPVTVQNEMKKRLYSSPVYEGMASYAQKSILYGTVSWKI